MITITKIHFHNLDLWRHVYQAVDAIGTDEMGDYNIHARTARISRQEDDENQKEHQKDEVLVQLKNPDDSRQEIRSYELRFKDNVLAATKLHYHAEDGIHTITHNLATGTFKYKAPEGSEDVYDINTLPDKACKINIVVMPQLREIKSAAITARNKNVEAIIAESITDEALAVTLLESRLAGSGLATTKLPNVASNVPVPLKVIIETIVPAAQNRQSGIMVQ